MAQIQQAQGIDALVVKELVERGDIVFERGKDGLVVICTTRLGPVPVHLTMSLNVTVSTNTASEIAGINPPLKADFAAAIARFVEQNCDIVVRNESTSLSAEAVT